MSNALNLPEIDQEQALNLSKFFISSGQNLFLFGRRGVGKTHIAIQAAQDCGYKVHYINLSVIERPDLAGYPDINAPGDIVTFKSPYYLPSATQDNSKNILLFDEVDKAPAEVTAPLLEILQFKQINGKKINAAGCILTGNLINEGAYSNIISSALLDRGAKYILSFNLEKWIDWAKANNVHDLILGFLRANPEFACGNIEDSCYASPSPRAWTQASEALQASKALKIFDIETISQVISGFVGNDAGLRFKLWYEYYRRFEPFVNELLDTGKTSLNYKELKPTEQVVFVVTLCYFAKQRVTSCAKNIAISSKIKSKNDQIKSKNKFVYLEHICDFFNQYNVEYEVQVMGFYNSFDFDFIGKYDLYQSKVFFDHFTKLNNRVTIKK